MIRSNQLLRSFLCILFPILILAFLNIGCTKSEQEPPPTWPPADEDDESALSQAIAAGSQTLVSKGDSNNHDIDFYLGETVFIGDSRTNGLITYGHLPPEQVYAIDGSNQETIRNKRFVELDDSGTKYTITEAVALRRPKRILLCFGINSISLMSEEVFMKEYEILVDSLVAAAPESTIILQSILPVAWWKAQSIPAFSNKNIDHYNDLLFRYASSNGYYYLNAAEVYKDEKNGLNPAYDAGDGLHFSPSSYKALMNYYRTRLVF